MARVWDANDDTVAELLTKGRLLSHEDRAFMLENLNVYYVDADNAVMEGDFNRVDREKWPNLAQEERLDTMLETQSDRAKKRGIEKGLEKGKQLGIEKGKQLGIEEGKKDMVKRFLQAGFDEQSIREVAQFSEQELVKIKSEIDRG